MLVRHLIVYAPELLTQGLNRKLGDAVTLTARVDSVGIWRGYVAPAGIMVLGEAGRQR